MFRLSTLVNGIYWECANMRDAFESAVNVSRHPYDVVIVHNTENGRQCYVVNGHVTTLLVNGEDYVPTRKRSRKAAQ